MSSKRCRIRFRSGDSISAVDEVACDDEARVASKAKADNQSLGVTVFVGLTGNTPQRGANNIASARRTAIHLIGIIFWVVHFRAVANFRIRARGAGRRE